MRFHLRSLLIWLAVASAVLAFPPQRRVGVWSDAEGRMPHARDADEFDRFPFGYIPTFQPATYLGTNSRRPGVGKTTISNAKAQLFHFEFTKWVEPVSKLVFAS